MSRFPRVPGLDGQWHYHCFNCQMSFYNTQKLLQHVMTTSYHKKDIPPGYSSFREPCGNVEDSSPDSIGVCILCKNDDVSVLFLPCRHVVCCKVCGKLMKHCYICQQKIIGIVNIDVSSSYESFT